MRVDVANKLTTSATVEIRERLPVVPDGSDVAVSLREVVPKWQDFEQLHTDLRGGRAWTIEIAPGQEQKLSATYVITLPHQHELIGGNRRES